MCGSWAAVVLPTPVSTIPSPSRVASAASSSPSPEKVARPRAEGTSLVAARSAARHWRHGQRRRGQCRRERWRFRLDQRRYRRVRRVRGYGWRRRLQRRWLQRRWCRPGRLQRWRLQRRWCRPGRQRRSWRERRRWRPRPVVPGSLPVGIADLPARPALPPPECKEGLVCEYDSGTQCLCLVTGAPYCSIDTTVCLRLASAEPSGFAAPPADPAVPFPAGGGGGVAPPPRPVRCECRTGSWQCQ